MSRLDLDTRHIEQAMAAILRDHPWLSQDEDFRRDVLEGETSGMETLRKIVIALAETQWMAASIAETIERLSERRKRFDRRADALRSLAYRIMAAADLTKVTLPEATLSLLRPPPKVVITDEAAIPPAYLRTMVQPDKIAISKALKSGEPVAGAALSNGEPALSVRWT